MNFLYGPSVWLLPAIVFVALLLVGPLFGFVIAALLVLIKTIQLINEYRKNQKNNHDDLEQQLEMEILKYKNKQKGTKT